MIAALADNPDVKHVQRYSTKPGMIKTSDAFQGMVLKGIGPEYGSSFFRRHLVEGEFPQFSDSASTNRVVISKAMADKMKLKLGDKIDTYYIQDEVRARRLTVTGIYQTNFSEYDNLFLLTDLCLVNRLNKWRPDQVSGVELELYDYDKLEEATYRIALNEVRPAPRPVRSGLLCAQCGATEPADFCMARHSGCQYMGYPYPDDRCCRLHDGVGIADYHHRAYFHDWRSEIFGRE